MSETTQSFGEQAARFSLYAPIVALVLGFLTRGMLMEEHGASMVIPVVNISLIVAGLLLGIFALISMRKYGTQRILGRAIGGVVLNAVVLLAVASFLVPIFLHRRKVDKVAGHWRVQSAPSLGGKQIDLTFAEDRTFHYAAPSVSGDMVTMDGHWVLTQLDIIGLTIDRANTDAIAAGKKIALGKLKSVDEQKMVVGTDGGDEVYARVP